MSKDQQTQAPVPKYIENDRSLPVVSKNRTRNDANSEDDLEEPPIKSWRSMRRSIHSSKRRTRGDADLHIGSEGDEANPLALQKPTERKRSKRSKANIRSLIHHHTQAIHYIPIPHSNSPPSKKFKEIRKAYHQKEDSIYIKINSNRIMLIGLGDLAKTVPPRDTKKPGRRPTRSLSTIKTASSN